MKPKMLLRLLALICIVISSLLLSASHFQKSVTAAKDNMAECAAEEDNTQSEPLIWQSLSRHLLSYN